MGIDISEGMLKVARQKVAAAGLSEKIQFKKEDCLDLSFEENSFDAVQVAYGVRNFEDLDKGLSEMFRVLKPGGHAVIVELSSPLPNATIISALCTRVDAPCWSSYF